MIGVRAVFAPLAAVALLAAATPASASMTCLAAFVFFQRDSAELDAQGRTMLDDLGRSLPVLSDRTHFVIEATANDHSDANRNHALSWQRGKNVFDYLVRKGLPAERIRIRAVRDTRPWSPTPGQSEEENLATNRRVIVFSDTPLDEWRRIHGSNVAC